MSAMAAKLRVLEYTQPPHRKARPNKDRFGLGNRERQVLAMLAMAKKPKAIAQELDLACSTVWTYRLRGLHKLGLPDVETLIHFAFSRGMEGVKNLYADEPNG